MVLVVDLGDHVARQHAGLGRGRIVDRRHHLDEAVFHRDLDAEPAELAMGGLLHVAPALLIHVARMRIERGDHAVDGAFHQLGIVGLLDVAGLDPLEHVAEQIELGVGVGTCRGLCRRHQTSPLRSRHDNGQTRARHRAEKKGKIPAHRGASLFACGRPQFPSIGAPVPAPPTHNGFLVGSRHADPDHYGFSGRLRDGALALRIRSPNRLPAARFARSRAGFRSRAWRGCPASSRIAAERCGMGPPRRVSARRPSANWDC